MANIAPPPKTFIKFYHIASNLQSCQLTTWVWGGGGGGGVGAYHESLQNLVVFFHSETQKHLNKSQATLCVHTCNSNVMTCAYMQ